MTTFRNLKIGVATLAVCGIANFAFADAELDALLADEANEPAAGEAAAVAEKPAAAAEEPVAEAPAADAAAEAAPESVETSEKVEQPAELTDQQLLENIRTTELLRRQAFNQQAERELSEARDCMDKHDYKTAGKHYSNARKLFNDSPNKSAKLDECAEGAGRAYYLAALEEEAVGRRAKAMKLLERSIDFRYPKAKRQYDAWKADDGKVKAAKTAKSELTHRRNDEDYKEQRESNRKRLKRSRQLLAVRDLDGALEECELVLVKDPYNQEALRLRNAIQKKRSLILGQEFEATREGLIADVGKAWRPVYAPNARVLDEVASTTVKKQADEDTERSVEQTIVKRMKATRLPQVSFKPPATIIDAIEKFKEDARDYDPRQEIPYEQRGINLVLKTAEKLKTVGGADADDFSSTGNEDEAATAGIPVIPMITANDISLFEALKLVCEQVGYKFTVRGSVVVVMPKEMASEEMITRSYPVMAAFKDRIGSASSEVKEMKGSSGFGSSSKRDSDADDAESDWKEFFSLMGVRWPDGSSILYIPTIGKLRVKNTPENLSELEKALSELNVEQKLIEIEARFVEVQQEDLNSLGFEWILNSDYNLNTKNLGKWLGINEGGFITVGNTTTSPDSIVTTTENVGGVLTTKTISTPGTSTTTYNTKWQQGGPDRNIGINAFGGSAEYGHGNRYLSTEGNHISGKGESTNDQFMKFNAFLGSADVSMILHMLSQRSDTDLLSAPKVITRPGEEAVIKVVTEYIYPTDYDVQLQSSSSSGSGSSSSQSAILAVVEPQSFTMREVGVILDVTPTLTDDGNLIDLKLNTQVVDEPTWMDYGMQIPFTGNASSGTLPDLGSIFVGMSYALDTIGATLSDAAKQTFTQQIVDSATASVENLSTSGMQNMTWYDVPMKQPFFHVRSIDSNVSIYPGATIAMGGLITEQRKAMDDKVPFLGDIPFIGRLFRSHAEQTIKRNLIIFVTTRLVDVRGRELQLGQGEIRDTEVQAAPEEE